MKSHLNETLAHQQAIIAFLDMYGLAYTEEHLWQMFRLTLSSEEGNDWNEIDRASWFTFYELLRGLVRANYGLVKGRGSNH